jgi:uncharacterized protein YndB with AHSA1/START domain
VAITTDSEFAFAAPPATVCAALADTHRYQSWWPWLTEFEASGLHDGARWRCEVRSPMALTLRFEIRIDEVIVGGPSTTSEASLEVRATLSGDIAGTAKITVTGHGGSSSVRFVSNLNPRARMLSAVSSVAPPLARRAHDHVVRAAAHQFRDALTDGSNI